MICLTYWSSFVSLGCLEARRKPGVPRVWLCLEWKRFRRTLLQNPKGSWGGFGIRGTRARLLRTGFFPPKNSGLWVSLASKILPQTLPNWISFSEMFPAMCSCPPIGHSLRWAKSRDSYRRGASESYRCDSNRKRSLAVISPSETQKLVLIDPAFVVLRFESRDWRSFVEHSFHVELRNGLRELTAFAEGQRLAIGDFAHLRTQQIADPSARPCTLHQDPHTKIEASMHWPPPMLQNPFSIAPPVWHGSQSDNNHAWREH